MEFLSQTPDPGPHAEYYRPGGFPVLGQSCLPAGQELRRLLGHTYTGTRLSLEDLAAVLAKGEGVERDCCGSSREAIEADSKMSRGSRPDGSILPEDGRRQINSI